MITEVYVVHSIDGAGARITTQVTEDLTEARATARAVVAHGAYPRSAITCWRLGGSWFIAENVTGFERNPETGETVSTHARPDAQRAPASAVPAGATGQLGLMAGGHGP
jgi:hypothetical protein